MVRLVGVYLVILAGVAGSYDDFHPYFGLSPDWLPYIMIAGVLLIPPLAWLSWK